MLLQAARFVVGSPNTSEFGEGEGWLRTSGGRIVEVGRGSAPDHPDVQITDGWVAPAFIDIHCHGGAGGDVASGDQDAIRTAARYHATHGTGGMLASLVTASVSDLCQQLEAIANVVESGDTIVLGSHLEGPFLSKTRCGAQNPAFLIEPDIGAFERMITAARGTLRLITVAPELPRTAGLITAARRHGVTVAIGHTDASYEQCRAAIDVGATVATHLFNGMRPIHHRDPGPAVAALDARLWCELINDGIHLHPGIVRTVQASIGDRTVLVTDAISAAGLPDGSYELGGLAVTVSDGAARLTANGSLAGSTLTMDDAVRRAIASGIPMRATLHAASTAPADAIGLADRGRIALGARADLVQVADDGTVTRLPSSA